MWCQHPYRLWLDVVTPSHTSQVICPHPGVDGETVSSIGVIKGAEPCSFEALQLENTILRAWIALHLKSGEEEDIEEWVRTKMS